MSGETKEELAKQYLSTFKEIETLEKELGYINYHLENGMEAVEMQYLTITDMGNPGRSMRKTLFCLPRKQLMEVYKKSIEDRILKYKEIQNNFKVSN